MIGILVAMGFLSGTCPGFGPSLDVAIIGLGNQPQVSMVWMYPNMPLGFRSHYAPFDMAHDVPDGVLCV